MSPAPFLSASRSRHQALQIPGHMANAPPAPIPTPRGGLGPSLASCPHPGLPTLFSRCRPGDLSKTVIIGHVTLLLQGLQWIPLPLGQRLNSSACLPRSPGQVLPVPSSRPPGPSGPHPGLSNSLLPCTRRWCLYCLLCPAKVTFPAPSTPSSSSDACRPPLPWKVSPAAPARLRGKLAAPMRPVHSSTGAPSTWFTLGPWATLPTGP